MSTYKSLIKLKLTLQVGYQFSNFSNLKAMPGYSPLAATNVSKHFLIGQVKFFLSIDQVKVSKRIK